MHAWVMTSALFWTLRTSGNVACAKSRFERWRLGLGVVANGAGI